MPDAHPAPRGRGSESNPPNRFREIHLEPETPDLGVHSDEDAPDLSGPRTRFFRDTSRTVLSWNDSPDVGFEVSVNPYRGCDRGCVYCVWEETPVLMGDGSTRRIQDLRVGDSIYGTQLRERRRYLVRTQVLDHWRTEKPAWRVRLADGTELIASADHRFWTERGWKFVAREESQRPHLTTNNSLLGTGRFAAAAPDSHRYRVGYLCGVVRGDGHIGEYSYERSTRGGSRIHSFRLAMTDPDALARTAHHLRLLAVPTTEFCFQGARSDRKEMRAIRTNVRDDVHYIRDAIRWPPQIDRDWACGYLAGLFDAEGSYSCGILRITNTDSSILDHALRALALLSFDAVLESPRAGWNKPVYTIRVRGGLREHLRFFHTVKPAISRKQDIEGQALHNSADLRVVSVEPLGVVMPMCDVTTGTGDFIANGVVSHNCYARPTHEYLGLSAGLDFESMIFVKEEAPELLREELESPRWTPRVIAMSGVTDPYQSAERRFGITRRCLEVLAEFRNPVGIVTKSALVTRDVDLLAELASHGAAKVHVSITSLDRDLQRVLEPRASIPAARLAAIETLTKAGVPCGVLLAPIVPALTDHEMPEILAAARKAGAVSAGYTVMRLPYAVKDLFVQWLERHRPDRKEKVLNRIREVRAGALNDPRFGSRMEGEGIFAQQIRALFEAGVRRAGFPDRGPELSTAAFRRPAPTSGQLQLFPE